MMVTFFYSRVSTIQQNSKRQLAQFRESNEFDSKNVYVDKIQGNVPFFERPEAIKLFDRASVLSSNSDGVTIVIDSIDRLGRNLIDILNTIEVFTQNNINLKSLKEGFSTLIEGKENPIAKVVISVMGSIAEMERNRIKERTKEGIEIAKANGKYKGRKIGSVQTRKRLLERHQLIVKKLEKGLTYQEISDITGKSSATISKVKKALMVN